MVIVTIRFTINEEKMLKQLTRYYHETKPMILKRSIFELYEDLVDRKEIEKFQQQEKRGKMRFYIAEELFALYDKQKSPRALKLMRKRKTIIQ